MTATLTVWTANLTAGPDALGRALGRRPGPDNLQSSTWAFYEHGKTVSAVDLLEALAVYNRVSRQVGAFFETYDLLVTPSNAAPAPSLGYVDCNPPGPVDARAWNDEVFVNDIFMPLFNTTGNPAVSLPLHETAEGLPVGVQPAAPTADEATLIQLAAFFEQALPWAARRPAVHVARA